MIADEVNKIADEVNKLADEVGVRFIKPDIKQSGRNYQPWYKYISGCVSVQTFELIVTEIIVHTHTHTHKYGKHVSPMG